MWGATIERKLNASSVVPCEVVLAVVAIAAVASAAVFVSARVIGGSITLVLTPETSASSVVIAITTSIGMRFAPSAV